MFSGFATAVEASALVAVYALVVQTLVHRDLSIRRDLLRVFTECAVVVGGVLVILGVAVGFTNYLVGAQVPATAARLVAAAHRIAGSCSCWRSTCFCSPSAG